MAVEAASVRLLDVQQCASWRRNAAYMAQSAWRRVWCHTSCEHAFESGLNKSARCAPSVPGKALRCSGDMGPRDPMRWMEIAVASGRHIIGASYGFIYRIIERGEIPRFPFVPFDRAGRQLSRATRLRGSAPWY